MSASVSVAELRWVGGVGQFIGVVKERELGRCRGERPEASRGGKTGEVLQEAAHVGQRASTNPVGGWPQDILGALVLKLLVSSESCTPECFM